MSFLTLVQKCMLLLLFVGVEGQWQCNPMVCTCLNNICSLCISNLFYLSTAHNTCYLCPSHCASCANQTQCDVCADGYYLADGQCVECGLFCDVCSESGCSTCMDGYSLDGGACVECALDNVQTCDTPMTVSTCQQGYWKNGDSCSPCREFCYQCTSSNNCLQCSEGYEPVISAGTYCTPCPTGCSACSSSLCTSCIANYRLVNSLCISFLQQCQLVSNCAECQYNTQTQLVSCAVCEYPYYLKQGECVLGASLMCRNGAVHHQSYGCVGGCGTDGYRYEKVSPVASDADICRVQLWVADTDIVQYYLEAPSGRNADWWEEVLDTGAVCDDLFPIMSLPNSINGSQIVNTLRLKKVFRPYYKLVLSIKIIPRYKSTLPDTTLNLSITMSDNTSNTFTASVDTSSHEVCTPSYLSLQSKKIKDQSVTITFTSTVESEMEVSTGLIGIGQILIQLYRCSEQCRICSNSKYCIECYGQLFVYEHKCVSQCYGFYEYYAPDGDPSAYTSKSCVKQCPSGFYTTLHPDKQSVYMCKKCEDPCISCKSQTQCLSCVQPLLYYDLDFACIDACPTTHYNSSFVCMPCVSPCLTCVSEATCTSCSIGFYHEWQCLGFCPDGTYPSYQNNTCSPCNSKCIKCTSSPNICSSCVDGYYLLGTECVDSCPEGVYYAESGVCVGCRAPCLQCINGTACLSCLSGYLDGTECVQNCPSGMYINYTTSTCDNCLDVCVTCSSLQVCHSCSDSTLLYRSSCVSSCPERTYPSWENNVCLSCVQPCLTCTSPTFCLVCQVGYISGVQPGTCVRSCQDGYYPSQVRNDSNSYTNKVCLPCAEQCATCKTYDICLSCANMSKVLSVNQCVDECKQGYYENDGICVVCSYPCVSCNQSSTQCLSCATPYILDEESCVSQCPTTSFDENGQCMSCVYPCRTCSSLEVCLSCVVEGANQTYLYLGQCLTQCPETTYPNSISQKCSSCSYPCLTCSSSRVCLSCASGYLNPLNSQCQLCPSSYFANETSNVCELCSTQLPGCLTCSSATACRYCDDAYYLYDGSCISEIECWAKSGYYVNVQRRVCASCVLPCATCTSQTVCTSCSTGFYYNSKCITQCPDGYYAYTLGHTCEPCNSTYCLTCTKSALTCLSCHEGGDYPILKVSAQTCISERMCGQYYYLDWSFGYGRCLSCQSPCLLCSGATECLSCVTGILMGTQCQSSCPISYFIYEQTVNETSVAQCLQCSSNCLRCISTADTCIECQYPLYLQNTTCVSNCSQTYYLDENSLECNPCKQPCYTCQSNSYCISCIESTQIVYYGQCIEVCPDGTYRHNGECIVCPDECQLCFIGNDSIVLCKKCVNGLFMNSSVYGSCESTCEANQYADTNTRDCYQCQMPCETCVSGTLCSSCVDGYLIYGQDCIKGDRCPTDTYRYPNTTECVDDCPAEYWGDGFEGQCVQQCLYGYVKSMTDGRLCVEECSKGYQLQEDMLCVRCTDGDCGELLTLETAVKSIFNTLYLRIKFSHNVTISVVDESDIRVQCRSLNLTASRRRLLTSNMWVVTHKIDSTTSQTVWMELEVSESLGAAQLLTSISSNYLFPGQILQNTNSTAILTSFDYYSSEQILQGQTFQPYGQVISIIMILLLLINMCVNRGYLVYPMLDYYQLLFILLFLDVDYPPTINNFLHGFRYAHLLFLPQIFHTPSTQTSSMNVQEVPTQFGILVRDVSFLNNTGHDFLVLFVVVGLLAVFKVIDLLIHCRIKSNKITNQQKIQQQQTPNQLKQKQYTEQQPSKGPELKQQSSQSSSKPSTSLSTQILTEKHGCGARIVKQVVNRIKWNYFNDVVYILYLYMMLFAFTQTYDMSARVGLHYASNVFAVIFLIGGVSWPVVLFVMLTWDRKRIQASSEVLGQYKCFYGNMKSKSYIGLMYCPIRYVKKLILAVLFVYASMHATFILGVIIAASLLTITITLLYKPYSSKLQMIVCCLFEVLFVGGCLGMLVLLVAREQLSVEAKIRAGGAIVGIFILLSVGLVLWDIGRLVVEVVRECCGRDLLGECCKDESEEQDDNTGVEGQSNIKINVKNTEKCESDSSGFGIELKRGKDAPPMLIKCMKPGVINSLHNPSNESPPEPSSPSNKTPSRKSEPQQADSLMIKIIQPNFTVEEEEFKNDLVMKKKEEQESNVQESQPQNVIFPELIEIEEDVFEADPDK